MAKRTEEGLREADFSNYKPAGKSYNPPASLDDMTAVIEMGLEAVKKNRGRQARYPDTPEGLEAFYQAGVSYFERLNEVNSCKDQDTARVFPDFEGLAVWCGISRITLFNYEQRGGAWAEMIGVFKTLITSARKQLTTSYKVPPMWEIFNLINNGVGYQNTNHVVLSTDDMRQVQEEMQIQDRLEANNLIWNPETGEYEPEGGESD
jgi:hypothetical protein